ncbi:MAG: hypothetical protein CMH16_08955 [Methylobacterium sp.]|jgi:hypothetical protein|nr:hypothetical protein [Methylobacterium sp.]
MAPMLTVICCGIPRSGSTWLFNATRLVVAHAYKNVRAGWHRDIADQGAADAVVMKMHDFEPDTPADKVLLSHRDIRDIIVSGQSMGWAPNDAGLLDFGRVARRQHDMWSTRADLDLPYEQIVGDPVAALKRIAETLGVDLSNDHLQSIAAAIPTKAEDVDDRGHNATTLIHQGHVTDGRAGRWQGQLSDHIVAAVTEEHGDWLIKQGYSVDIDPH